jgi:hypothetical protein
MAADAARAVVAADRVKGRVVLRAAVAARRAACSAHGR